MRHLASLPLLLLQWLTGLLFMVAPNYIARFFHRLSKIGTAHFYYPIVVLRRIIAGEPRWKEMDWMHLGIRGPNGEPFTGDWIRPGEPSAMTSEAIANAWAIDGRKERSPTRCEDSILDPEKVTVNKFAQIRMADEDRAFAEYVNRELPPYVVGANAPPPSDEPISLEAFAALTPRARGWTVYMVGNNDDYPHAPNELNPYHHGTLEHSEWNRGEQCAAQEVLAAKEEQDCP